MLIALATLIACSGQAQTPTPIPVAQAPTAAPVQLATAVPVEAPEPPEVPAATSIPTEVPPTATTAPPTEAPTPTDMPAPTATAEVTEPPARNAPNSLITQLSSDEEACIAETGDPQQALMVLSNQRLASPEERDALVKCLNHDTLLTILLQGFTDQTGPLSEETSACLSAGFQNFDLRTMMTSKKDRAGAEAAIYQGMAGAVISLSCLNEEEWQAVTQAMPRQPDDRETLQCVMNTLGGPEGIAASLESQPGQLPTAFFEAADECGLTMTGGPPN